MSDDLQRITNAVLQLQHALKSAGLEDGAIEVRLSHRDEKNRLANAIKASPSFRDMIADPRIGVGTIKIADVEFVGPRY